MLLPTAAEREADLHSTFSSFHCDHASCSREFSTVAALNYHKRSCVPSKKRLHGVLSIARELFEQRKKARTALPSTAGGENHASNSTTVREVEPPPETTDDRLQDDTGLTLAQRRPRRTNRQPPKRYRDMLPQPPPPLGKWYQRLPVPMPQMPPLVPQPPNNSPAHATVVLRHFSTPSNLYNIYRRFYGPNPPENDPDANLTLNNLIDPPSELSELPLTHEPTQCPTPDDTSAFFPYPNKSSFTLGEWYWNKGSQKSQGDFKSLLDIIGHPDFDPNDIRRTNWSKVNTTLAANAQDLDEHDPQVEWLDEDEGWRRSAITIRVPFHQRMKNSGSESFLVGELYHRSIVSVIKERISCNPSGERFYYAPYELLWKPAGTHEEIRIHGEMYTSKAFLDSHRELLESPGEPGCNAPRAIASLMFWSDATHITSFGHAKLWPAYMFFGNNSKYQRCRPSQNLSNHIAYFQKLPDSFKDFFTERSGGKKLSKDLLKHLHREVFHAQWEILLDDDFIYAWRHGILICCSDGVTRRIYPRIFTYSADYPEKVLIAGIRNRGNCPCPRCLISMALIPNIGMESDMRIRTSHVRVDDEAHKKILGDARSHIYDKKYAVNSQVVENLLKPASLLPSANAFSKRLSDLDFNLYSMLVVDLLHEFELGVWRALFIQLVRILHAINSLLVNEMDRRYREVPRFGQGVIRKFSANASELKKMAARDYEDLLQCSMPVFEGLFPEPHDEIVQNLLFECAHWHTLAKLRMHTDLTLKIFEDVTVSLGNAFRRFENETCAAYTTYELPREFEARKRREAKTRAGKDASDTSKDTSVESTSASAKPPQSARRRKRAFNMATYKFHALADYPGMIRLYGTCDSYSTELGELEHRTPKARYRRTDRKHYIKQITQIERRQTRIRRIRAKNFPVRKVRSKEDEVSLGGPCPEVHHKIGKSENTPEHIGMFIRRNDGDPAIKGFIPKLKKHLLPRIKSLLDLEQSTSGSGAAEDWELVAFHSDRIYGHATMRVNFTGYDIRRGDDVINARSHKSNIMVLNPDFDSEARSSDAHPFWYAKVLGIYHANVIYIGSGNGDYRPRRIEFIWVRWYDLRRAGGWDSRQLDQLEFSTVTDEFSYDFVDPGDVLRGCHLIPSFHLGRVYSTADHGLSHCAQDRLDFKSYFVGRFVDRDIAIRYHWGVGIGHTYASPATGGRFSHGSSDGNGAETNLDGELEDSEENAEAFPNDTVTGTFRVEETGEPDSPPISERGDSDSDDGAKSEHSLSDHDDNWSHSDESEYDLRFLDPDGDEDSDLDG
ncbi:hypothetical protein FPV67DRAFT_1429294 [Lyophyllum atratum]|nr:hypothetical protein FPV67DRAFT_1429294 [Lyophyllum atratum]